MTMMLLEKAQKKLEATVGNERGGVAAYGIAWLFGVPVTLLVLIWLIRGN
jgi:hypothetical protein